MYIIRTVYASCVLIASLYVLSVCIYRHASVSHIAQYSPKTMQVTYCLYIQYIESMYRGAHTHTHTHTQSGPYIGTRAGTHKQNPHKHSCHNTSLQAHCSSFICPFTWRSSPLTQIMCDRGHFNLIAPLLQPLVKLHHTPFSSCKQPLLCVIKFHHQL